MVGCPLLGTLLTLLRVKRNAASSPLLNLPRELREKIWWNLLGDQTIHIHFSPSYRPDFTDGNGRRRRDHRPPNVDSEGTFNYVICQAEISDREAYEMFQNSSTMDSREDGGPDMRLSRDRHAKCYRCYANNFSYYHRFLEPGQHGDEAKRSKFLASDRVHLAILRVCRQAYVEVNPIFWGSTTWSFVHALDFCRFMHERNTIQRRFLRKLHLDIDKSVYSGFDVRYGMTARKILEKLRAVEIMHVDVRADRSVADSIMIDSWLGNKFSHIMALQFLPLKTVTVTVMEKTRHSPRIHIAKIDKAEAIRMALLDYRGAATRRRLKEEKEKEEAGRQKKGIYPRNF